MATALPASHYTNNQQCFAWKSGADMLYKDQAMAQCWKRLASIVAISLFTAIIITHIIRNCPIDGDRKGSGVSGKKRWKEVE